MSTRRPSRNTNRTIEVQMTEDMNTRSERSEKIETFSLTKLQPSYYRMWRAQAETTFTLYNCFDIVKGEELRPVPEGQNITPAMRKLQRDWDIRHYKAKDALLKALDDAQLVSVYNLNTAAEIWLKLKNEYGQVSLAMYSRAKAAFYGMIKNDDTSMQDHINDFKKRLELMESNRPDEVPALSRADTNITFMQTLGVPENEKWTIFEQALGERFLIMETEILYTEVLAKEKSSANIKPEIVHPQAAALASRITDDLSINFTQGRGNRSRGRVFRGSYRGGYHNSDTNHRGRGGHRGGHRGAHRSRGRGGQSGQNYNQNRSNNVTCYTCGMKGHYEKDCGLHYWQKYQLQNSSNSGNGNANPSQNQTANNNTTSKNGNTSTEVVRYRPHHPPNTNW